MEKTDKISLDILHKEIDLIQDIIKRMSHNSFLVKGWMITIFTTVIILLSGKSIQDESIILSASIIFVVISFWYLDAFFIHKEKCYRKLYEYIITNQQAPNRILYSTGHLKTLKKVIFD